MVSTVTNILKIPIDYRSQMLRQMSHCFNIVRIIYHPNLKSLTLYCHMDSFHVEAFLNHRKFAFSLSALFSPSPSIHVIVVQGIGQKLGKCAFKRNWVIDEKASKALWLMWGYPRSICFCLCVLMKVETPVESSNLHDIYTGWMK